MGQVDGAMKLGVVLGLNVGRIRRAAGLNQEDVARRALNAKGKGLTNQQISDLECGRCVNPTLALVERVARGLGVGADVLMDRAAAGAGVGSDESDGSDGSTNRE